MQYYTAVLYDKGLVSPDESSLMREQCQSDSHVHVCAELEDVEALNMLSIAIALAISCLHSNHPKH